jgi:hypothetical protein
MRRNATAVYMDFCHILYIFMMIYGVECTFVIYIHDDSVGVEIASFLISTCKVTV